MNSTFARTMPAWRSFVWAGVVASVLAWAWAWSVAGGSYVVMVFVAIASVLLAYRGMAGMRWALAGLMIAGFAMFLASMYGLYVLAFVARGQVGPMDWVAVSFFPMVAAIVLLAGAVPGFRHTRSTMTATTETTVPTATTATATTSTTEANAAR